MWDSAHLDKVKSEIGDSYGRRGRCSRADSGARTGSGGTTLAILAARYGLETCLLARTENEAARLASDGENRRFLAGYPFPEGLAPTADYTRALDACDLLMMVVPSQTM